MAGFLLAGLLAAGIGASVRGAARPGESPQALAVAGGHVITTDDFAAPYLQYLLKTGQQDHLQLRRAYVNHLVDVRLAALALRDAGIENEEAYRFEREAVRRKLLLDAYAERMLFDTLQVSEADLRALFVRANTQLKARHLYARTREQADRLYERLQRGETFEDLAREVFADPVLAASGGSVGLFGFDEMDPAFEEAAYGLQVGEISKPVQTSTGYSIIQLEDRMTHPILTEHAFAERRAQLERYLLRRKRAEALFTHSQRMAEALDLVFDDQALDRLMAQIDGTALAPAGEAADAWLAAPLLSFGPAGARQTWTIADFRERAQYTSSEQRAQVTTRAHLQTFISGLVVRDVLVQEAIDAGMDREPRYTAALEAAMDEWLFETARARVAAEVVVPEDSVRAHFEAARDVYVVPEKVQVREILVETKAEADALRARLEAEPFEALARVHSIRPGADAAGGDLGFVSRAQLGRLADAVFKASEGDIVGPVEVAGRYALLQVGPRRAAEPATFEASRAEIAASLQWQYVQQAFRAYLDGLRERYDVTIDEAAVAAVRLP